MEIRRINNEIITLYNYDPVGNVTDVYSEYPWRGNFSESFHYDKADQLVEANANDYYLGIDYDTIKKWGKINRYYNDIYTNGTYTNNYFYYHTNIDATQTSFAPELQDGTEDVYYTYGINGSLRKREVENPVTGEYDNIYYLFNSQGNMKAYSNEGVHFAYYGYDASNTRTYKISMSSMNAWLNGAQQDFDFRLQQAMFYPNAYINFDAYGNFTKHYYNGTERICSRLGDTHHEETIIEVENKEEYTYQNEAIKDRYRKDILELLGLREDNYIDYYSDYENMTPPTPLMNIPVLRNEANNGEIYYYHTNHLGSTAFVTEQNQNIIQGFVYAPFGEIVEEYNATFGNDVIPKYSFNAKELDEETGMYYYEARYYAPPVFTSRDPLMNEKPWLTPYHYCSNNPVGRIDPSGMSDDWYENELTGEVFYNSQMGRNDAGKGNMTGEGWKWMGENNMFGEVNDAFIDDNLDFLYSNGGELSRYNCLTDNGFVDVDEMRFGGNSEAFMSKMGYDRKPITARVDVVETSKIMDNKPQGGPVYNVEKHDVSMQVLTSTYVKKNTPSSYKVIDKSRCEYKQNGPLIMKTTWTETRRYSYGKNNYQNLIGPVTNILNLAKDIISICF